jgi:acyl carrier protein
MDDPLLADPRVRHVFELFAREARIDPATIDLDRRIDELGVASLDMALALFELEDQCGIVLPEPAADAPVPTLRSFLHEVAAATRAREALAASPQAPGGAATAS